MVGWLVKANEFRLIHAIIIRYMASCPTACRAVPPHTRRRLGYNPKAGRAASAALTAVALVDDRLALKAAAAAGHASQRR